MMNFSDFLTNSHSLGVDEARISNLLSIRKISEAFHRDAGIKAPSFPEITEETYVIEAAHQPNYFPYSGTWKKAFLADYARKKKEGAVCFYGFADYNQSTAPLLYQNRVPAVKKGGFAPVGYRIAESDRWKLFNTIKKPSAEEFDSEQRRMKAHYGHAYDIIGPIMEDAYLRAGNLADYNAYVYAKICDSWGLEINFFRYSDVQNQGLFVDQARKIISSADEYNSNYNSSLAARKTEGINPTEKGAIPFWHHCACRSKVALRAECAEISGSCERCGRSISFSLEDLEKHYADMSPSAVARNIIYSEGLGTTLYVSGAGGGLEYGQIADDVSTAMGYRRPVTIAYRGKDYYLGKTHRALIKELCRILGKDCFCDPQTTRARIAEKEGELSGMLACAGCRDAAQNYSGQLMNLRNRLEIAGEMFSENYSFIDQLAALGSQKVVLLWTKTFDAAHVEQRGFAYLICGDVSADEEARTIYMCLGKHRQNA